MFDIITKYDDLLINYMTIIINNIKINIINIIHEINIQLINNCKYIYNQLIEY